MTPWTPASLIAFEERVKDAFIAKRIHAPIHLNGGNESQIIAAFADVREQDWCLGTWRSHYMALLKGMPADELFEEVLAGRSMFVMSAKYKILCSAIVGGMLPIACGLALGIKRKRDEWLSSPGHTAGMAYGYTWPAGDTTRSPDLVGPHRERVHCFVGDMCSRTGLFHEFIAYCDGHRLPCRVIIEDDGLSTDTPTQAVWGSDMEFACDHIEVIHYKYQRKYPHVGVGEHVHF